MSSFLASGFFPTFLDMESHTLDLIGAMAAISGGLASYLNDVLHGEKFAITKLLAKTFVGGFIGMMVMLIAKSYLPEGSSLIGAFSGISALLGYDAIKPILERTLERFAGKAV